MSALILFAAEINKLKGFESGMYLFLSKHLVHEFESLKLQFGKK